MVLNSKTLPFMASRSCRIYYSRSIGPQLVVRQADGQVMPSTSAIAIPVSEKLERRQVVPVGRPIRSRSWLGWRRWARAIITIRATPRQVALGVALGSFIAFTPLIGLQMILAGLFATLVGASKKAAMLAVWISNPLTMGPIFALTYQLGVWLGSPGFGSASIKGSILAPASGEVITSSSGMNLVSGMQTGSGLILPMLLGGAVLGLVAAVASYVITHQGVKAYQTTTAGLVPAR